MKKIPSIEVDDKVKTFVQKKGGALTISSRMGPGCCGVSEEVDISYKKPKHEARYQLIQKGDLSIYLEKGLPLKAHELRLSLMGRSIFSSVHVDGVGIAQ